MLIGGPRPPDVCSMEANPDVSVLLSGEGPRSRDAKDHSAKTLNAEGPNRSCFRNAASSRLPLRRRRRPNETPLKRVPYLSLAQQVIHGSGYRRACF